MTEHEEKKAIHDHLRKFSRQLIDQQHLNTSRDYLLSDLIWLRNSYWRQFRKCKMYAEMIDGVGGGGAGEGAQNQQISSI